MKIKMTVNYGEDICECLKEAFGCETDDELFVVFRAVMRQALAKKPLTQKTFQLTLKESINKNFCKITF